MCIVTGPWIELAVTLIDRLKRLFTAAEKQPFSLLRFDTKETVIELNRVHIEAYPSHHLDAMRGYLFSYPIFGNKRIDRLIKKL